LYVPYHNKKERIGVLIKKKKKKKKKKKIIYINQNFGMIEEDLYRSGQPNELNFPFLEKLGLKTIAWLAPEEPNQRL
jgi:hypothetical protein